jgi:hypothetical protein
LPLLAQCPRQPKSNLAILLRVTDEDVAGFHEGPFSFGVARRSWHSLHYIAFAVKGFGGTLIEAAVASENMRLARPTATRPPQSNLLPRHQQPSTAG